MDDVSGLHAVVKTEVWNFKIQACFLKFAFCLLYTSFSIRLGLYFIYSVMADLPVNAASFKTYFRDKFLKARNTRLPFNEVEPSCVYIWIYCLLSLSIMSRQCNAF